MSSSVIALCFSLFLLCLSTTDAFNITKILSPYPDFTAFNNYLIQTGVATEINRLQTITVLAVANANMSDASGLSQDAAKKILSVHVVLDYYDMAKLDSLNKTNPVTLTTLFQQSGLAQNQQGFINVTEVGKGGVAFGSASPGSSHDSIFIKSITNEPYNLSVLQVTNIIKFDTNATTQSSPPPSPQQPPAKSPTQAPTPPAKSPSNQPPAASPPRKVLAPPPSSKSPAPASPPKASNDSSAPASSDDGPASDSDSPTVSPSVIPVEVPSPSDSEADTKSAGDVTLASGSYLASILVILTTARFLLTMNI